MKKCTMKGREIQNKCFFLSNERDKKHTSQ